MKMPTPPPRHAREAAPDELAFRFSHGAVARTLDDFAREVERAPAGTIRYHRPHFAAWIREVLGDEPLAIRVETFARDAPDDEALRQILVGLARTRLAQLA